MALINLLSSGLLASTTSDSDTVARSSTREDDTTFSFDTAEEDQAQPQTLTDSREQGSAAREQVTTEESDTEASSESSAGTGREPVTTQDESSVTDADSFEALLEHPGPQQFFAITQPVLADEAQPETAPEAAPTDSLPVVIPSDLPDSETTQSDQTTYSFTMNDAVLSSLASLTDATPTPPTEHNSTRSTTQDATTQSTATSGTTALVTNTDLAALMAMPAALTPSTATLPQTDSTASMANWECKPPKLPGCF